MARLEIILPQLKASLDSRETRVYETCHSSDDMLDPRDMEEISRHEYKERKILIHKKGFIFDKQRQKVAEWNPIINPPFYTIMFPADIFFDPQKHYDYMRNSKSHEDVGRIFDPVKLPDYRYCVVVHGQNISTNWWHPFRGKVFSNQQARKIMAEFGITIEPSMKAEIRLMIRHYLARILIRTGFYKMLKWLKNKTENYFRDLSRDG